MAYDRMNEYIETIFQVYIMVVKMTRGKNKNNNDKLKCISLVIYNYLIKLAKGTEFDLSKLKSAINGDEYDKTNINLVTFFEYIAHNNIALYDFSKIAESDMDVSNSDDIERFVLSHIYYLTQ
jgi:hypothetical protein